MQLPTCCPLTIWAISLEFCRQPHILEADDLLGACYRRAMTPKKLWTLLFSIGKRLCCEYARKKASNDGSGLSLPPEFCRILGQDAFDHDKGQKSAILAISGRRLHRDFFEFFQWIFFTFLQVYCAI